MTPPCFSQRLLSFAAASFLALGLVSYASAEDKLPNPEYANWAKFKPGTTITTMSLSDAPYLEGRVTTKLLQVTPEKVVVEVTVDSKFKKGEDFFKGSPEKKEIPKMLARDSISDMSTFQNWPNFQPATKTTEETIKVPAGSFKTKCLVTEVKSENKVLTMWVTNDVPGGYVKREVKKDGKVTHNWELTEFKKAK